MTGDEDQARLIAERIARRVSGGPGTVGSSRKQGGSDISAELSAMRAGLENLTQKLVQLESRLNRGGNEPANYSDSAVGQGGMTWSTIGSSRSATGTQHLSSTYAPASHPSQERFGVEEATVSELVDFFEGDKKCELEPGGQPCDHCAMCSSRGF